MKLRHILSILLIVVVTFLSARMITAPTDFELVQTIGFPEFPDLAQNIPNNLSEKVAVVVDGQIAYKNTDDIQPTASTAKMILALMVIERQPFLLGETGGMIEINEEFYNLYSYYIKNGGSYTRVEIGEKISEYDGLASVLLPSSNNMADTLAIWAFGSLDEYRRYAQNRLEEWGIMNTTVGEDASGFLETTTSSASDLALIAQRLMDNPVLAEIVGQKSREVPVAGEIKNTNKLLGELGIVGVKTGFIGSPSGYCLISAYKVDNHIITVAVLGALTRERSFEVTSDVTKSLQAVLEDTEIFKQGQEVGYYESWWAGRTPIVAEDDVSVLAWSSANVVANINMPKSQDSSETVGTLDIMVDDNKNSFPIFARDFRAEPSVLDRLLYALFLK